MDADEFLDTVRTDRQTELSRLGASKSLYADTGGDMGEDSVLAAVADSFHHAAETFETWVDEESGDASETFADAADLAGEQYGVLAGELGDHDPGEPPAIQTYLRDLDTTVERLAGYVGWALVTEKKVGQAVGFFVGQASPQTASTLRDVRDAVEGTIDEGAAAVAAHADGENADLATDAGSGAVGAAYDEYFETLESLGVNPKPVC